MLQTKSKGVIYYTNKSGRGIFKQDKNREIQLVGTNDAPMFRNARQLNSWIRRHMDLS